MPTCIETTDLTKCYGHVVAVGGLSLRIEVGEIFGLLGPNGAGKSTTLYMLTGLVRPTSGTVTVFGKDLRRAFLDIAGRMGVLVERPSFYDHLTARANLLLLARLAGRGVTVDRALDRAGLLWAADRKVHTFSHGMRQRLGLAQALLTEPELLILDEPTNGLDTESARDTIRLLRLLAERAKVTIIVSSNLLHEAEALCDRVAIMNRGRLLTCERTDKLLSYDPKQVEVIVEAPEAAAKRLMDQPWVDAVETDHGRINVKLGNATIHQLTSFLISSGCVISGVIPQRRSLEDFFLKAIKR
ncbi:MAG TPA: ABC transporter ATP-binding protein [Candidatus Hydrogenedentes bacterium]|nr:ABC transporter ATP-binding protein [Candidatus Hydrogenedentota bacterium]